MRVVLGRRHGRRRAEKRSLAVSEINFPGARVLGYYDVGSTVSVNIGNRRDRSQMGRIALFAHDFIYARLRSQRNLGFAPGERLCGSWIFGRQSSLQNGIAPVW